MKLWSIAIAVAIGSGTGYFVGARSAHDVKNKAVESLDQCDKLDSFKSEISGVTPEELREYLRTQDADEKLKKADEILAQIVKALILHIGLRLKQDDLDQFGHLPPSGARSQNSPGLGKSQSLTGTTGSGPGATNPTPAATIRDKKTAVELSPLPEQAQNLSDRITKSTILSREQIENLKGKYEGVLYHRKVPGPHRIILRFFGKVQGDKNVGNAYLQIFNPKGKSAFVSQGPLGKRFSAEADTVFIILGEDAMELTFFPALDEWRGNFFEKEMGRLERAGTVVLKRQQ